MSTSLTICHGSRRVSDGNLCTGRENWWNSEADRLCEGPAPFWRWPDHSSGVPAAISVRRRRRSSRSHAWNVRTGSQVPESEQRGPQAGGDDAVVGAQPGARVPEVGEQYFALAINNRPRKIHDWRTPAEVFAEQLHSLQQPGVATTD